MHCSVAQLARITSVTCPFTLFNDTQIVNVCAVDNNSQLKVLTCEPGCLNMYCSGLEQNEFQPVEVT